MVYSNKFSFCIVVGSDASYSVLDERADGIVPVSYGQSYGIKLINKNGRRAVAEIRIDGERVGSYVLNAHDSWIIWRHSDKDQGFMLVALESLSAAIAGKSGPNDGTKGVVEVSFKLERLPKVFKSPPQYTKPWTKPSLPWTKPDIFVTYGNQIDTPMYNKGLVNEATVLRGCSLNAVMNDCVSFAGTVPDGDKVTLTSATLGDAVTVPSGPTGQSFGSVYIDTEEDATILRLVLKGVDAPLVTQPDFCTNCGNKRRKSDKFCGQCGSKL
jgi:hypothetical protein